MEGGCKGEDEDMESGENAKEQMGERGGRLGVKEGKALYSDKGKDGFRCMWLDEISGQQWW